jgi:hypothetical protein
MHIEVRDNCGTLFGMTAKQKPTPNRPKSRSGAVATEAAIGRVNDILRGPVVDVFRDHVPGLHGLSREHAFDMIMNNPELADCCFKLFRKRPELFEKIVIGPNAVPVTGETAPLICGRTLEEVVALVVRAIAKRHFRARFAPLRPVLARKEPERVSLFKRILGIVWSEPPAPKPKRKATRADSLYQAMRDVLLYEWQVPLIPHYAPLPVPLVRSLGKRILEYREVAQLRELALHGLPPEAATLHLPDGTGAEEAAPPPLLPATTTVATSRPMQRLPDGSAKPTSTPKAEVMWALSQTLQLPGLFGIDEAEMRRTVAHASAVSALAMAAISSSGMRMRDAVVFLCAIDRNVGHARMRELLGSTADPSFLRALVEHVKRQNIPGMQSPGEIREATVQLLDSMRSAGHMK